MLATVEDVAETDDGLAIRVGADLVALAEWIAFERVCCPFRVELAELGRARILSPASLVRGR